MVNPSITVDYRDQDQRICGVQIAFADGNTRTYKFKISISDDGSNFRDIFSGTSKGTTASERFLVPQTIEPRFVRLTITENIPGSSLSIAQISEIDATGFFTVIATPGTGCPPICIQPC